MARVAMVLSVMLLVNFSFAAKLATASEPAKRSDPSATKETCSAESHACSMSKFTIGILGTGRLGAHTAATWAAAGHHVLLGSRDQAKAREVVEAIRSPSGYRGRGGEQTKALPAGHRIDIEGTDMAGARRPLVAPGTTRCVPQNIGAARWLCARLFTFGRRRCISPNRLHCHAIPCN
jgi:hypothetical protein